MTMIICVYSLPYSMPLFHMNNETDCVYMWVYASHQDEAKEEKIKYSKKIHKCDEDSKKARKNFIFILFSFFSCLYLFIE